MESVFNARVRGGSKRGAAREAHASGRMRGGCLADCTAEHLICYAADDADCAAVPHHVLSAVLERQRSKLDRRLPAKVLALRACISAVTAMRAAMVCTDGSSSKVETVWDGQVASMQQQPRRGCRPPVSAHERTRRQHQRPRRAARRARANGGKRSRDQSSR